MTIHYRPFARCSGGSFLAGLMATLRDRGVEAQWHDGSRRDRFMALVGGEGGLEVHTFFGHKRIPKLGRVLLIEAVHPAFISPEAAPEVAFFCDRANEALYGGKIYLRRAPGDASVFQVVAERGVVLGGGGLSRIADEFDLLVSEYLMIDPKLNEVLAEAEPLAQAQRAGLFDLPAADTC